MGCPRRGPAILFDIYQSGRPNQEELVALETLIDVQSGIPTRINEFFYLDTEEAPDRKIERCYLFPVVKSTRSSGSDIPFGARASTRLYSYAISTERPKGKRPYWSARVHLSGVRHRPQPKVSPGRKGLRFAIVSLAGGLSAIAN